MVIRQGFIFLKNFVRQDFLFQKKMKLILGSYDETCSGFEFSHICSGEEPPNGNSGNLEGFLSCVSCHFSKQSD